MGTVTEEQRRYLDYVAAVAYTGLSRHTIWRAVRRGEITSVKVGTAVRFDRADLDLFMNQHKK